MPEADAVVGRDGGNGLHVGGSLRSQVTLRLGGSYIGKTWTGRSQVRIITEIDHEQKLVRTHTPSTIDLPMCDGRVWSFERFLSWAEGQMLTDCGTDAP